MKIVFYLFTYLRYSHYGDKNNATKKKINNKVIQMELSLYKFDLFNKQTWISVQGSLTL
jgi:hypothetical protein